ncbi:MAG: glycosyltransferase [Cytophagaceae bacterium]
MKKLTVIIVNYNVCHFLEQALYSVKKAAEHVPVEIIVVDNDSADNSVDMVREKFPEATLIENKKNLGFSKANNQAIKISTGEYILLLNPDTVVEEDTFIKCCQFMDEHPDAGGLGVKMLDGKGNFLPESKRGTPTPAVAFYKIFGLAKLFPQSRTFGKYHLTYLDREKTHKVDILSGAFMFIRKSALDKIGLLDEDFFMYGEDIDLSYRLLLAGYKNYYFPETRIIHYKGESTKKTSINYVFIFYNAMAIFAHKHFTNQNAWFFSFLINLAIYLRAGMAIVSRIFRSTWVPLTDATLIYTFMYFLTNYWEDHFKIDGRPYPPVFMEVAVPIYIFIWLSSIYFSGGYDRPASLWRILRGAALGSFIISGISNFFDPFRFSKALIILGGIASTLSVFSIRTLIHFIRFKNLHLGQSKKKRVAVIGYKDEGKRVLQLLKDSGYNLELLGYITPGSSSDSDPLALGHTDRMNDLIQFYNIDELIFCSKDLTANQIIEQMSTISKKLIEFKIVPDKSNFIIGSNNKNTQGNFYTLNIDLNLTNKIQQRNKRVLDIGVSILFLTFFPVLFFIFKKPGKFFMNLSKVLIGKYSWVGISKEYSDSIPSSKEGVVTPVTAKGKKEALDEASINHLNYVYARDYSPYIDIRLIIKSLKYLDS